MESRVDHRLGLRLGVSHHSISRSDERKSASRRSGQCAVLYQEPWTLGRGVTGAEKEGQRGGRWGCSEQGGKGFPITWGAGETWLAWGSLGSSNTTCQERRGPF